MGNGNSLLLIVVVFFAVLVYQSFRARRRLQRQREQVFGGLRPGAEVVTTAGLFATVVEVLDDGTVRLETAPGQVSRWDRLAVARVVTPEPGAQPPAAPEAASEPAPEAPPGTAPEPGPQARPTDPARTERP